MANNQTVTTASIPTAPAPAPADPTPETTITPEPKVGGDLLNATIVAKPLTGGGDLFAKLKPKNPNVVFRGINYSVPIREQGGLVSALRYEQAKAQGFSNVTLADVHPSTPVPPMFVRDNGQRIVNGDLILMKIDAALYRGALKWKDQQALRTVQRFTDETVSHGKLELSRAMQEVNAPGKLSRKLSPFSPTSDELRKDFGDNE